MAKRPEANKPLWRKKTPGVLYIRELAVQRIKPKQEIQATLKELGNKVNEFEILNPGKGKMALTEDEQIAVGFIKPAPEGEQEEPEPEEPDDYSKVNLGHGWFNVVSSTGKIMNENKLREADADQFIVELKK